MLQWFYVTKYATMQQLQKNQLPFLFFCKLVSNDAAAQLPPGGPTGPWALRKTRDTLPRENFVARLRWYCHVSTMITEHENGCKYSIWLSLLLWKDCLPDTHTLMGWLFFVLTSSFRSLKTSGDLWLDAYLHKWKTVFSSTGVKRVFFSFSIKIDCICLSQCRGKDPSYCCNKVFVWFIDDGVFLSCLNSILISSNVMITQL